MSHASRLISTQYAADLICLRQTVGGSASRVYSRFPILATLEDFMVFLRFATQEPAQPCGAAKLFEFGELLVRKPDLSRLEWFCWLRSGHIEPTECAVERTCMCGLWGAGSPAERARCTRPSCTVRVCLRPNGPRKRQAWRSSCAARLKYQNPLTLRLAWSLAHPGTGAAVVEMLVVVLV